MNIYVTKNSLNNFYQRVARKNIFAYCHIASLSSSTPSSPTACSRTHSQTFGVFDVSECEKSSLSFIMSCDVGISDFHDIFATLMRSSHAIELSLIQLSCQPASASAHHNSMCTIHRAHQSLPFLLCLLPNNFVYDCEKFFNLSLFRLLYRNHSIGRQ